DWEPVVHSPDGSSWQGIGKFYLRAPNWTMEWPVKKNVSPGEYRFSFIIYKIFTKWEGPPGTSEISSSKSSDGRVIHVDGYASPKRIYGWGLGDVITVVAGDSEKTVNLHSDTGPKVRLRTTFFPNPATIAAKDSVTDSAKDSKPESESEKETLPQRYQEARNITMRVFREENFSTDRYLESNSYGIPWYVDFDHMKPGRYYVHFYRETTPPETGTTVATDIFSFDVTENGSNDFVFTPEKSLAENAAWQVVGTVRDEKGTPMPNINVSITGSMGIGGRFSFYSANEHASSSTDAEGNYRLNIKPSFAQSGAVFDTETNRWRWGFRVQQATIRPFYFDYYSIDTITPDREGDLFFLGEFATDELKKQLADRTENKILVEMNQPAVVNFTIPTSTPRSNIPPWQELDANPERRKQRFEFLEHLKTIRNSDSYKLFQEIVLPNSLNRNYIEAMEIGSKISATLTADKPEFMFHEPVELKWNIANGSDYDVSVMIDENMGSPTVVWAVSDDGDVLLEKERFGWHHSGPVYYERILPKSSFPYKIFLPDKFAIPKPARYTVNIARNLLVRRIEPAKDGQNRWFDWGNSNRWTAISVPVFASMNIDVVPTNTVKLGEQINELVRKIQDRKGQGKYEEAEKALKVLCAIDDERVIPCLVGEIRKDNYSFAFHAIAALSKFKSDAAFEGIKKAFKLSDDNLLRVASRALADSKHPNAIQELLKNHDHLNYSVRLIVVQSAKKMNKKTALEMLRKHFNDTGWEGNVGKEAQRIYKELTGEGEDDKEEDEEKEIPFKLDGSFLNELRRLSINEKYDKVLRKTTKALEHNPDNAELQEYYIKTVSTIACNIFLENNNNFFTSPAFKKVPLKLADNYIEMLTKSIDMLDKMPIDTTQKIYDRPYIAFFNIWEKSARIHTPPVEYAGKIIELQKRLAENWMRTRKTFFDLTVGKKNEADYVHYLTVQGYNMNALPIRLSGPLYVVLFRDFLKYSRLGNVSPQSKSSWFTNLYSDFRQDMSDALKTGKDGEVNEPFLETIRMLEDDDRLYLALRGWYLRQEYEFLQDKNSFAGNHTERLVETLKKKIESLPENTNPKDYDFLYKELLFASLAVNPEKDEPVFELYEFAFSRNDAPELLFQEYPSNRDRSSKRLPVFEKALEIIQKQSAPGKRYFGELGRDLENYFTKQLDFVKEELGLNEKLSPWKSCRKLLPTLPDKDGICENYIEPIIFKNHLFVFVGHYPTGRIKLVEIDLESERVIEGNYVYIDASETYDDNTMGLNIASGPQNMYCPFADEKNVYLGTNGHGLLVFPRDRTQPWRITTDSESIRIPNDYVTGIGSIGGNLYLGLGQRYTDEQKLVRINLDSRKVELLASTSMKKDDTRLSKDAQIGFCDLGIRCFFQHFVADTKRDRLLFYCGVSGGPDSDHLVGLWSIDGKSGEFKHLLNMVSPMIDWAELQPNGDELILFNSWQSVKVNLQNDSIELYTGDYYSPDVEIRVLRSDNAPSKPLLGKHYFSLVAETDGWAWGVCASSRAPRQFFRVNLLNTETKEILSEPEEENRPNSKPYFTKFLTLSDRKSFLACTCYNIWLFQVED
ncbi:MAG: hypothetical protein LBL62_01470, partial [Planctomycetaceae bacterium]|nr:hypothetical protein [Planctomycetaceae bacterium]